MNEHERFVKASVRRRFILRFNKVDPAPGELWSAPLNSSEFLDELQRITADEWDELHNQPFWHFLHIGGDLPN